MITELDAYRLTMIAKLHFTTEAFDCTKTKSLANLSKRFDAVKDSRESMLYRWASKNFKTAQEYCKFLIANYLNGVDPRFTDLQICSSYYKQFVARKESMTYVLETDFEMYGTQTPYIGLLSDVANDVCSPEFVLLLDSEYKFLDTLSGFEYIGFRDLILGLRKYRSFFDVEKYRKVLKK